MTEVEHNGQIDVRLPGGGVTTEVGSAVMGPPGLRGPRGERGDPGGTTTVVFAFRNRAPDELPESGLIPAGWDDARRPEADIQVGVGQSCENQADGYLWLFVGPSSVPGGWIETGQVRGPPGDAGPVGDTGPAGPPGERGLTGQTGDRGPRGDPGETGPQGARGEIGQTGSPGATGATGPKGDRGDPGPEGQTGPPGEKGDQGEQGEQGERGDQGPEGQQGERGDQGDPGGPSFIVDTFITRTASELATITNGLIPANWDGPGRPAAPYQMKTGEAWLDANPADTQYHGQAIVYVGAHVTSVYWIPMIVTGPAGATGPQGGQGPQGATGAAGAPGADGAAWHWWPQGGPPEPMGKAGDMILCLAPVGSPPGHGDVYQMIGTGQVSRLGSILGPAGAQGPAGPQGPPGTGAAELEPRVNSLETRVNRLEAINAQQLTSDAVLAFDTDTVIMSVPLSVGDHVAQGTFSFELDRGTDVSPSSRVVTMWVEASGPVALSGNRAGQCYLHQALPFQSLSFGPMRALVTGTGNAVVHYRVTQPAGEAGPVTGRVLAKAATVVGAHPGASGFVSR